MPFSITRSSPILLPFLYPSLPPLPSRVFRRCESSARRTTKKLRTKPDQSFSAATQPEQLRDYIVFNPPSSSPSPYQTPPAFLPPQDPRRALLAQSHRHANPYIDSMNRLPPLARKVQKEKKHHLDPKDMEEIRRLRQEDPIKWTRKTLSEKFECSQFFVGLIAEATPEKKRLECDRIQAIQKTWGKRRKAARGKFFQLARIFKFQSLIMTVNCRGQIQKERPMVHGSIGRRSLHQTRFSHQFHH